MSKIFVSYNPNVQEEQSIALRLQTLSSLYGISILLPDRYGSKTIKTSTQERISEADLFVLFSTQTLSKMVSDEVLWALREKKKVLIIYDKHKGKNLRVPEGVIEIDFDPLKDSPDQVLQKILKEAGIKKSISNQTQTEDSGLNPVALAALLLVGLGLVIMAALTSKEK